MFAKSAAVEKRARALSRIPKLRVPRYVAPALAVLVGAVVVFYGVQRNQFERNYRQFVIDNEAILHDLQSKPQSPWRDQAIQSVQGHLEWASQYQRTGIDPELFEEIEFRRELNARP